MITKPLVALAVGALLGVGPADAPSVGATSAVDRPIVIAGCSFMDLIRGRWECFLEME